MARGVIVLVLAGLVLPARFLADSDDEATAATPQPPPADRTPVAAAQSPRTAGNAPAAATDRVRQPSGLASRPWAKRLIRMWTGEAPDDTQEEAPLDPRVEAWLQRIEHGNLFHVFRQGGPIMWPLLIASTLAMGTVMERLCFFAMERLRRNPKAMREFMDAVRTGRTAEAIAIGRRTRFFVVRALSFALEHHEVSLQKAIQLAKEREIKRYAGGVAVLDTVITLAPLLGLLGTVTGMMASFSLIGGDLDAPGAITGGIAEALIATAFGLGIAITSLIPFNLINERLELVRRELEDGASTLQLLLAGKTASKGGTPS